MCTVFKAAVRDALPHAVLIVDRFHVAQPANTALTRMAAWNVKEDLMDLLALHGTSPDRTKICELLVKFHESAAACGLPEMERLATTVSTWWPQILAAIATGITNAASEGINRLIKTDARCAFGHRNPGNQRLRARCAPPRRARGYLQTRTSGRHGQPRRSSRPQQHGHVPI